MKKIGFALSFVLSELGLGCLFITALVDKTLPTIGKMASQISNSKEYGELMYSTDLTLVYVISIVMIILGTILCVIFYRREKND